MNKGKMLLMIFGVGIGISLMMMASDFFLRDRIFGINLLLWPLSFVIGIAFALSKINKEKDYAPSFLKSFGIASAITIISSVLFGFYWIRGFKLTFEFLFDSIWMVFPEGILISFIIALIYRGGGIVSRKKILYIYIIISLMDSLGGGLYQAYEEPKHGYEMIDIEAFLCFLIFTVIYTLVWYREVERKSDKNTWYIIIVRQK